MTEYLTSFFFKWWHLLAPLWFLYLVFIFLFLEAATGDDID